MPLVSTLVDLSFAQWLLLKRKGLKLSQTDLAEALSVSRQTIANWEAERSIPTFTVEQIYKLCELLQCSLEEIPRQAGIPNS